MTISSSQSKFPPSRVSFSINLNSKDPSPIYETSLVSVFVLVIFISILVTAGQTDNKNKSLKIENENNSTKLLFPAVIFFFYF